MTNAELHELAVATDTQLADLSQGLSDYYRKLEGAKLSLAHKLNIKATYVTKTRREVKESLDTLIEMAQAKLPSLEGSYLHREMETTLEMIDSIKAQIADTKSKIEPLDALWMVHQWSRFFLVNNTGGHIHTDMNCHSCNLRTQYMWLPTLSGLTEKDAVEAHGTILCTHCYPSAPVEWTAGITKNEDDMCPGSRTAQYKEGTFRRTGFNGNGNAICSHCNEYVSVTANHQIRKHKVKVASA